VRSRAPPPPPHTPPPPPRCRRHPRGPRRLAGGVQGAVPRGLGGGKDEPPAPVRVPGVRPRRGPAAGGPPPTAHIVVNRTGRQPPSLRVVLARFPPRVVLELFRSTHSHSFVTGSYNVQTCDRIFILHTNVFIGGGGTPSGTPVGRRPVVAVDDRDGLPAEGPRGPRRGRRRHAPALGHRRPGAVSTPHSCLPSAPTTPRRGSVPRGRTGGGSSSLRG